MVRSTFCAFCTSCSHRRRCCNLYLCSSNTWHIVPHMRIINLVCGLSSALRWLPLICTLQLHEWHCVSIGSMSRKKRDKSAHCRMSRIMRKLQQAWGLDLIKLSQKDILLDIHSIYVEDTRCKSVFLGQGSLLNVIRRVNHVNSFLYLLHTYFSFLYSNSNRNSCYSFT